MGPSGANKAKPQKASSSSTPAGGKNASSGSVGFKSASTHQEFGAALSRMCAAMEIGNANDAPRQPPLPGGLPPGATVIGDFEGAVFGLESLNLSPEEHAKLNAALQKPLSRNVTGC